LQVRFVQNAEDILSAERLIFPGVGAFGACVDALQRKGFMEPLRSEDGARNDGE
jgi:glutamine amidotransferase/cyclase